MQAARVDATTLDRLFESETVYAVLTVMCDSCFAMGGDKFSYHPEVMFEGISSTRSNVFSVGFPDEWVNLYIRDGGRLNDPGPDTIMRSGRPMTWHDALKSCRLNAAQLRYVAQTIEYGLTSGYGFPLWGPNSQNAFVAVGFPPDLPLPNSDVISSQHIVLLTGHQRICELTRCETQDLSLSHREREVLTWVGRGKSNTDIASILSLSVGTVATYIRRIYAKLECNDRVGAVITALRLGLIRI